LCGGKRGPSAHQAGDQGGLRRPDDLGCFLVAEPFQRNEQQGFALFDCKHVKRFCDCIPTRPRFCGRCAACWQGFPLAANGLSALALPVHLRQGRIDPHLEFIVTPTPLFLKRAH
jgi:hypothetical protein